MDLLSRVREYWDVDALTYDHAASHRIGSPAEWAAWNAVLLRLLPPPPARVLDVGAGTGFLTLLLAQMGYEVTALDLSQGMLARLEAAAQQHDVEVEIVHGPAHEPPPGPFDAVAERHLLWLMPDPAAALAAWRQVAPAGRLVMFEGLWGAADSVEAMRQQIRGWVRQLRGIPLDHHASTDPAIREHLPLGNGTHPNAVVTEAEAAGWRRVGFERLRDVEWARLLALRPAERLLGTTPQYVVHAFAE
jgi:SAM-dependent methyltransferase